DAAGDERAIGIALQKRDDHFMPNVRQVHGSPSATRPGLRYPNPAGTPFIALAVAIPVKLNPHAPVLVGVDLLARWSPDHRRLRPVDERLFRHAHRPERHVVGDGFEAVVVARS